MFSKKMGAPCVNELTLDSNSMEDKWNAGEHAWAASITSRAIGKSNNPDEVIAHLSSLESTIGYIFILS